MKKILIILGTLLIIAMIYFLGFVDIRIINTEKIDISEKSKMKYNIILKNHKVIKMNKIYLYKTKEQAKEEYRLINNSNQYLGEDDKIGVKLNGKKVIISMTREMYQQEFGVLYIDETDIIETLESNNFKVKTYLDYTRILELFGYTYNEKNNNVITINGITYI